MRVCPQDAIAFGLSPSGTTRAYIREDRCIGDGKCAKACPVRAPVDLTQIPPSIAARIREDNRRAERTGTKVGGRCRRDIRAKISSRFVVGRGEADTIALPGEIAIIRLELEEAIPFVAGQHVVAEFAGSDGRARCYTVAGSANSTIELCLRHQGRTSGLLAGSPIGTSLLISNASGEFTLASVPVGSDLVMVSAGTGVAPFVAMLRDEDTWSRFGRIRVLHAARSQADVPYLAFLANLSMRMGDRFDFTVCTRGADLPNGFVSRRLDEVCMNEVLPQWPEAHWFLCGGAAMVRTLVESLLDRGLHMDGRLGRIHAEIT
jgi:ferredoxin-NADP reductase